MELKLLPERVAKWDVHPFDVPCVRDLRLVFDRPVTFFVGENGAGKSTVLESLAVVAGFPAGGGGRNEGGAKFTPESTTALVAALRPSFSGRPRDGYFFRAEFQAHFASLLEERKADPLFRDDPYARYGGKSLHERSHGEAYLAVLENRVTDGLYILDEPEAALSPQRQLSLLALMWRLAERGDVQFIIATHSPILLTFPNARILSFDDGCIAPTTLEQTSHYQITRGVLERPEQYWKHLREPPDE